MFTGMIQGQIKIVRRTSQNGQVKLTLMAKKKPAGLKLGDSVAVDGVCLTVSKIRGSQFDVDVVKDTLRATHLGHMKKGETANFETSLRYGDSVGGHFVTGHVDGTGKIKKIDKRGKNISISIQAPAPIISFLAVKGSVAVDGISLTIQKIKGSQLTIAIIPHTYRVTTLNLKRAGDRVHLEIDQTMRYVMRLLKKRSKKSFKKISLAGLKKQGF